MADIDGILELAEAIYGEGAGSDYETKKMIGSTILNRIDSTRDKEFGNDLNSVMSQGYYAVKDNSPMYQQAVSRKFPDKKSEESWKESMAIASALKNGKVERDKGEFYFKPSEIKKMKDFDFKAVKEVGSVGPYKVYQYKTNPKGKVSGKLTKVK